MEFDEVKLKVRRIINDNTGTEITLTDEDSLVDGVLDSMIILGLITAIESDFNIIVNPLEFSIENFNSINNIAKFIFNKIVIPSD